MTATAADYETGDCTFVRSLFQGFAPDPAQLPGWAGISPEGKAIVPQPAPSTTTGAPTIYAHWGLRYRRVIGDYEDTSAPIRYGDLVITRYQQADGVDLAPLRLLRAEIVDVLAAASDDGPLDFILQAVRSEGITYMGPWAAQNLVAPFVGA